ncbi:MAG: hypothetical protein ACLVI4_04220 [Anaerovoracaceae bacterium]
MAEKRGNQAVLPALKTSLQELKVLPGQVQKPERRRRKFSLRKKQTDV